MNIFFCKHCNFGSSAFEILFTKHTQFCLGLWDFSCHGSIWDPQLSLHDLYESLLKSTFAPWYTARLKHELL